MSPLSLGETEALVALMYRDKQAQQLLVETLPEKQYQEFIACLEGAWQRHTAEGNAQAWAWALHKASCVTP